MCFKNVPPPDVACADGGDRWGFLFSPPNCITIAFLRFLREDELDNLPVLHVYDQPIAYNAPVRFSGVMLDTRLHLNTMVLHVKTKAVHRISVSKCVSGRGCGAYRSVLLRTYMSIVRPILDYACHILNGPRNTAVDSLDAIQTMSPDSHWGLTNFHDFATARRPRYFTNKTEEV